MKAAPPGVEYIDKGEIRIGDEMAVWWGGGWARIISMAPTDKGDLAVLYDDGTADVVLSMDDNGGCHAVRLPRGAGASAAELLAKR